MRTKRAVTNSGCHIFGKFSSTEELGKIQGIQLFYSFLMLCTHECTLVCMHNQAPRSPKFTNLPARLCGRHHTAVKHSNTCAIGYKDVCLGQSRVCGTASCAREVYPFC